MGIYLANARGFSSQILDLVVRGNAELVPNLRRGDMSQTNDASFVKYDQFQIYFNPGAKSAKTIPALNKKEGAPKYEELFNQTVVAKQEKDLRKDLTKQLEVLSTDINKIVEFSKRAGDNKDLQIEGMPKVIAEDVILKDKNGLRYESQHTVAGGFDFDWQSGSVKEGYLDDLLAKSKANSYDEFFAMKAKEVRVKPDDMTYNKDWRLKDGTLVADLNDGSATGRYQELNESISDLTQAWQSYYQDKVKYQKDLLGQLLKLEYQSKQIADRASVNASDKALQCY